MMQSVALPTASDCDSGLGQRVGSEHPKMGTTGQIRRRVRRATASALPHNPHKKSLETRRSLPTPVHTPPSVSPRPPSTSPPQRLLHRASRVAHRNPQHASAHQDASPQSTTSLDPVQLHKKAPDVTDLLKQEGNSATNVCVITRSSPPVLPPIPTISNFVAHQNSETSSCRIPESHQQYPLHPTRHRHVILARSQGLNSAPSSVRVLAGRRARNLRQSHCEGKSVKEGKVESGENRSKAEGILLVKEEPRHQKSQAWQELHQSGSD